MAPTSRPPQDAKDWMHHGKDPENPRQWSLVRKVFTDAVVGSLAFEITLAGSIWGSAHDEVAAQWHVSSTVSLLPLALYNLGLAFGPVLASPLSETFGRKLIYQYTLPVFALFMIGSGLSKNIASLPWSGSMFAPFIGKFMLYGKGWRWTQWTALFFTAALFCLTFALKESYKQRILRVRARKLNIQGPSGSEQTLQQELWRFATATVVRPLHMLFTESIVGFLCLYAAFDFGLLYILVVASPALYGDIYGFSFTQQGLSSGGLIIGTLVAPVPIILMDRLLYQPSLRRSEKDDSLSKRLPEERLYAAMLGSTMLPIRLFWYGWTMRNDIHWICPMIAQGVTIDGCMEVYIVANLYLMDTYGPLYGASSKGANSFARYGLSAATPLFANQMFNGLGVAWAASLLGFCALALAPIPWVLHRWGPTIRAKRSYPAED